MVILTKVLATLLHAFAISMILSLGGTTQEIFVSIFNSEEASLYDSLYKGGIAVLNMGFFQWIETIFNWIFFIPSQCCPTNELKKAYNPVI